MPPGSYYNAVIPVDGTSDHSHQQIVTNNIDDNLGFGTENQEQFSAPD